MVYALSISALFCAVLISHNRRPPSTWPDTTVYESSATSIEFAVELRHMLVVCRYVCFEMSQTIIWRSAEAVMIPLSVPKNRTLVILLACPTSWWTIRCDLIFHTRHVLSLPPPATKWFATSHEMIELLLPPLSVAITELFDVFQILTVPSLPPVARSVPASSYLDIFRGNELNDRRLITISVNSVRL
jgi:hypothetical protein